MAITSAGRIQRARRLRRDLTDVERRLWNALRAGAVGGVRFRRQEPIGAYVVDFVCLPARLVVEIDGGQHAQQVAEDAARTRGLEALGFRVIRFWNNEVNENLDGVLTAIAAALNAPES